MTEQFLALLKQQKESEFLSFLKSLTGDQKKKLTPEIKKLTKEYSQFGQLKGNSYGYVNGTDAQRELLQLSAFVCFNRSDYDKTPYSIWMLDKERAAKIIDWYCPSWFSDFVNKQAEKDFVPYYLHYDWVMELRAKGILQPSKELLVKVIPQMVFEQDNKRNWLFKPEKLLIEKLTLEEHIWYLFEVESNIHYSDRYLRFEEGVEKEKIGWVVLFRKYMTDGLLDRFRLLSESLLASNRNFNKVLSGWFAQLFIELAPTTKETLCLQKELFSVLSSPHSKIVNTSLQSIKNIVGEKEFDSQTFLDTVPVLLSTDTKATILSALMILDKLAQKNLAYRERIVLMIFQCFIHSDEAVQTKAAKVISKYGDSKNQNLRNEISGYYSTMLTTSRKLLANFFDHVTQNENIPDNASQTKYGQIQFHQPAEIAFPSTIDDLFFLASQAFDNNESWHIDLLPAALIYFQPQLKESDIQRFEPAFQRAFGLINRQYRTAHGYLDNLLAFFFIDYGNWLILTLPTASKSIEKIYRTHDKKEGDKQASFAVSPAIGSYTARWEPGNKTGLYQPYKKLLLAALQKIKQRTNLPLLSTPTHAPGWINPGILIDRLRMYQQSGEKADDMDLQVAISRCFFHGNTNTLQKASEQLVGEFRELMIFLLDDNATPQAPFYNKGAWMVASLTKKEKKSWPAFESFSYSKSPLNNYTGQMRWQSTMETYMSNRYDYQSRKNVKEPAYRKVLSVHREYDQTQKNALKKVFSMLLPGAKDDPPMLYEFLNYRLQYLSIEYNDIRRILLMTPNNPEPIVADTLNQCLKNSEFFGEGDKKMVTAVLQTLYEIWKEPGDMTELFLGTCMLSSDKTIVNIAGEMWLQAVSMRSINNAHLGKIIGLHESIEFAPMKRFTDLAIKNLFRISPLHNTELQILIENILPELPDEPIKNLKKLLEIYQEVTAINHSSVISPGVINRLKAWEKNAGLRKIAGTLINV